MNHGMIKTATAAKKHKKKTPVKKTRTIEIHESIKRIAEGELSKMGLFELSIESLMPTDVYHELKKRIELIRTILKKCQNMYKFETVIFQVNTALEVVDGLLKNPQETRR